MKTHLSPLRGKGLDRLSIRSRLRIVCALAARCIALCFVSADPDLARGACGDRPSPSSIRRFQVVPIPTALEDALQPSAHFSCATFATTVLSCTARR